MSKKMFSLLLVLVFSLASVTTVFASGNHTEATNDYIIVHIFEECGELVRTEYFAVPQEILVANDEEARDNEFVPIAPFLDTNVTRYLRTHTTTFFTRTTLITRTVHVTYLNTVNNPGPIFVTVAHMPLSGGTGTVLLSTELRPTQMALVSVPWNFPQYHVMARIASGNPRTGYVTLNIRY